MADLYGNPFFQYMPPLHFSSQPVIMSSKMDFAISMYCSLPFKSKASTQANALTGIIRYIAVTGDTTFESTIDNTFQKTKKITFPATGKNREYTFENYINEYYNNEGW